MTPPAAAGGAADENNADDDRKRPHLISGGSGQMQGAFSSSPSFAFCFRRVKGLPCLISFFLLGPIYLSILDGSM